MSGVGFFYNPPLFIGGSFNTANFISTDLGGFSIAEADTRYLKLNESSHLTGVSFGSAQPSKVLVFDSGRNITNINSLTATTLVGTLSTAAQTNITSVGTLSNLNVANAITAATISGTLSTPAQTNITSLGTLTNLNVTGFVSAATLSGTLTSPAQTNITSVGTLTNLTVSNTVSATNLNLGGVILTNTQANYLLSVSPGIATGSKAVILDSSKNITGLGSVGCGALACDSFTATSLTTTITSTGDTTLRIIANNTSTNMWPTLEFIRQNTSNAFGGDGYVDWRLRNDNGNFLFIAADNSVGSTEFMRITSLGLVGIGTNAPNAPLHIVGNARSFTIGSVTVYGEYGSGAFAANQLGPIGRNISIRCDNGIFTSTSLFCSSDRRLKKNIDDLKLDEAMTFVKTVEPKKYHLKIDDDNAHKHYGFVAQDIVKLGPAFVDLLNFSEREDFAATEEGDIKDIALSVDYQKISVLLHKVLKNVVADLDSLYESGSYAEWRRRRQS